ncbi:hypothetical protein HS7_02380 [Sulfolobales archaeon HS-7]|nr:hypothetical protein HS7_02380 [Sulfolobales archaeon HS-7]
MLVIAPSAFDYFLQIKTKYPKEDVVITTSSFAEGLKLGKDVDLMLDKGVRVKAFSHKLIPIPELSDGESESIYVAKEFEATLITCDEKTVAFSRREGIRVLSCNEV